MSVTITIEGNVTDCHSSGQIRMKTEECHCASKLLGQQPDPKCPNCLGRGEFKRVLVPYELNLSADTFEKLWHVLGLNPVCCWVDARTLRRAIAGVEIEEFDEQANTEYGGNVTHISKERALNYLDSLQVLCDVAEKRESPIVWQ